MSATMSQDLDLRTGTPGSVRTRAERLGDQLVMTFSIDASHNQGALSPQDGESIAFAAFTALEKRIPLVGFIASTVGFTTAFVVTGAAEARAFAAADPVLLVVTGPAVSGPALFLGIADLVVMIDDSYAFVSGPHMVRQFTGEELTNTTLGGAAMHARTSGVASTVLASRATLAAISRGSPAGPISPNHA